MGLLRVRTLTRPAPAPPPEILLRALPPGSAPVLLDSSDGSGWSLLAWAPDRECRGRLQPLARVDGSEAPTGRGPAARWPLAQIDPAAELAAACAGEDWRRDDPEPPLAGGWIGWMGFECAHGWEPFPWTPAEPSGLPDWHFARYRRAVLWSPDGLARLVWTEIVGSAGAAIERGQVEAEFRHMQAVAGRLAAPAAGWPATPPAPTGSGAAYRQNVARLREWIAAGELFQANVSHRLEGPAPADPRAAYAAVRRAQPTAMSAYWEDAAGRALLSWSPERFLEVHGPRLESRPIKGTAARAADPAADAAAVAALEASEKERAELHMIVDVARHDLGRVARPGGVEVASTGHLESLPTVHHRTASVRANWDPAQGLAALLRATFPPASVSGAPKVRALQAIAELEGEARGAYCGAFGAWEPGTPRGDFSVLIRTAICAGGRTHLRVGAGIVWDSDPEREWRETLVKAAFLKSASAVDARNVTEAAER